MTPADRYRTRVAARRCVQCDAGLFPTDGAAFVAALIDKQRRNERRSWPSGSNPDDATHHLEDSDP
ncbi:MAG: hypothetical protein VW405_13395 [Rhodospirillaceae bacterium]